MRGEGLWSCGALAVLAACTLAAPAWAATGLGPGVHLNPGSPAEKQYVLTLNQARQTGSSSSSSSSPNSSASSPLFGSGITPPRGGGGSAPASGSHAGKPHSQGGGHAVTSSANAPGAPLPAAVLRASRSQNSSAGSGSLLALLGGGLAILVLGGFGGTVLRHSRRATPPTPSA